MLLTREQFTSHVVLSGGSESGKTAGLCALFEQIVRLPSPSSPLVIDGKGTPSN
jgi:predicted ATPase